jgi:glycosyltransferase involved in cell wall biosynthesis
MAKILICTGIYPPHIGGPAQYAKEVELEFIRMGHSVSVLTYSLERKLPSLARHELFFWKVIFACRGVDFIVALDTFSVGWPAVAAAKFLRKKIIIRTGGDFLWETYVERTREKILFRDFYNIPRYELSWKEKWIFDITNWVLHAVDAVIFSTAWQKEIFESAYKLDPKKSFIVENYYGPKLPQVEKEDRVFVGGARPLVWKNVDTLQAAFMKAKEADPTIALDTAPAPYDKFLEKIRHSYAVVLVSLGDISPNMILDAIRSNTPFVLTTENGLYDRIKEIGVFADPKNPEDIKEKILFLADRTNCKYMREKLAAFTFTHTWSDICKEIFAIAQRIKK